MSINKTQFVEPPRYPQLNSSPSFGAVVSTFGASELQWLFGLPAVMGMWGFAGGEGRSPPSPPSARVGGEGRGGAQANRFGSTGSTSWGVWVC